MGLITLATKKWCGTIAIITMFAMSLFIGWCGYADQTEFVPVCNRSPSVRQAIEEAYMQPCKNINALTLAGALNVRIRGFGVVQFFDPQIKLRPVEGQIEINKGDFVGIEDEIVGFEISENFDLIDQDEVLQNLPALGKEEFRFFVVAVTADQNGEVSSGLLAPFKEIKQMSLWSNNLTILRRGTFDRLTNLNRLTIVAPALNKIENQVFAPLFELKRVSFFVSPLTDTNRAAFKGVEVVKGLPKDFDEKENKDGGTWD